jgi:hypothetical protein
MSCIRPSSWICCSALRTNTAQTARERVSDDTDREEAGEKRGRGEEGERERGEEREEPKEREGQEREEKIITVI